MRSSPVNSRDRCHKFIKALTYSDLRHSHRREIAANQPPAQPRGHASELAWRRIPRRGAPGNSEPGSEFFSGTAILLPNSERFETGMR
jgi:hypothetical protein